MSAHHREIVAVLLHRLLGEGQKILNQFPVQTTIEAFDSLPPDASYATVPTTVRQQWEAILSCHGTSGFRLFQSVAMLVLIQDFDRRANMRSYTASILDQFAKTHARVIKQIESPDFHAYDEPNDLLLKDLALCRQRLFPAGARVIEDHSGIPRSLAVRGGLSQSLKYIHGILLKGRGPRYYYQGHIHLLEMDSFTPDGWRTTIFNMAEMIEANTDANGFFCASWLYDPALTAISPHLAYLRCTALECDALSFYFDEAPDTGALEKSKTRRKLFAEGRYIPRSFFVVWPRGVALRLLGTCNN